MPRNLIPMKCDRTDYIHGMIVITAQPCKGEPPYYSLRSMCKTPTQRKAIAQLCRMIVMTDKPCTGERRFAPTVNAEEPNPNEMRSRNYLHGMIVMTDKPCRGVSRNAPTRCRRNATMTNQHHKTIIKINEI